MASSKQVRPHMFLSVSVYLLALAIIGYFFVDAFEYYTTPLVQRPFHDLYQTLKPGGFRSHGFGIFGALMLILLLGYSLRKRARFMQKLGVLRKWLNVHIFFGIIGPLLLAIHTTFIMQGGTAVAFWILIASLVSGFIAYYLYRQIPRTTEGDDITREEAESRLDELQKRLQNQFRIHSKDTKGISLLINTNNESRKTLPIRIFFTSSITRLFRLRRIKRDLKIKFNISGSQIRPLMGLVKQQLKLAHHIRLWDSLHKIFRFWHIIHIVLSMVMYILSTIHIIRVVQSGNTWIF